MAITLDELEYENPYWSRYQYHCEGTGYVPPRYCNQCGREEHGTAGCAAQSTDDQVIVPEQRLQFIGGIPYGLVDSIPPGAKPLARAGAGGKKMWMDSPEMAIDAYRTWLETKIEADENVRGWLSLAFEEALEAFDTIFKAGEEDEGKWIL